MHEIAVDELCAKLDKTVDCILHEPAKKPDCLTNFKKELEITWHAAQKALVTEMLDALYEGDTESLNSDLTEILKAEDLKIVPVFPTERAFALRNLVISVKELFDGDELLG